MHLKSLAELWKLRCPALWIIAYFILQLLQIVTAKPNDRIIFPDDEKYNVCHFKKMKASSGSYFHLPDGFCKLLSDCPIAVSLKENDQIEPQPCPNNLSTEYICCPVSSPFLSEHWETTSTTTTGRMPVYTAIKPKRRSQLECEDFYSSHILVVHVEPTKPREFPYMAALGWFSHIHKEVRFLCGGVLISERYVLTAAHCANIKGDAPIAVRLGGTNLTDTDEENIPIKKIIPHRDYNAKTAYHDIALIELERAVGEKPACVWSEQELPHDQVTTIGYGHTRFGGPPSDHLLKADLRVVENRECAPFYKKGEEFLNQGLSETQICAKDPENLRDSCQGDSGGPIMMRIETDDATFPYVVGITSLGQGCAGQPPSVYTRVSSYIDWIESIVWPNTSNVDVISIRTDFSTTTVPTTKRRPNLWLTG